MRCLRELRERQENFYWSEYNAFDAAKALDNVKRMTKIRQDCKAIFCDPADRRYYLLGNVSIW